MKNDIEKIRVAVLAYCEEVCPNEEGCHGSEFDQKIERKMKDITTTPKMNPTCSLIGHKETANDSGFPVCERCGWHGYWDYDNGYYHKSGILKRPIWWLKRAFSSFKIWIKQVTRKDDGLPF